MEHPVGHNEQAPLHGGMLIVAAVVLAMANFIAVLNITIANVTVPNMAGGLGAGVSQGTWIITSYAVAEAITIPLTGWLAERFGAVRVFVLAILFFGIFSLLCGLSTSLSMLIVMRVLQGLTGGPLVTLSQVILLRIFPKEKAMMAMGLWAMTSLFAPVVGPTMGGWLADHQGWQWVFFINVPLALTFGGIAWGMLKRYELPIVKNPVDKVGMLLLVVWVGALQLMLDQGKDLDWFASNEIRTLAVVIAIGFASFLIWELTDKHPIVDLRVFRHRGFSASMVAMALGFGAFFASMVLTPLWLQYNMGYNSTWAGFAVALGGLLSIVGAPIAAALANRFDSRWLVFIGVVFMGVICLWRSMATTDMTFLQIGIPLFIMGLGVPFFFVPLLGVAMGAVEEKETASASGLMNFVRTMSGAFGTSLVVTSWQNHATYAHAEMAGIVGASGDSMQALATSGLPPDLGRALLDGLVMSQSLMLATNQVMLIVGVAFILASFAIWLAPKPAPSVDPAAVGH